MRKKYKRPDWIPKRPEIYERVRISVDGGRRKLYLRKHANLSKEYASLPKLIDVKKARRELKAIQNNCEPSFCKSVMLMLMGYRKPRNGEYIGCTHADIHGHHDYEQGENKCPEQ